MLWVKCMTLYRIVTKIFVGTVNWMKMNIAKKIINFFLTVRSGQEEKKDNFDTVVDLSSINIFACFLKAVP